MRSLRTVRHRVNQLADLARATTKPVVDIAAILRSRYDDMRLPARERERIRVARRKEFEATLDASQGDVVAILRARRNRAEAWEAERQ
jgi:hypothetical protein